LLRYANGHTNAVPKARLMNSRLLANEIHDGTTEVRENRERDASLGRKHTVYDECGRKA